MTTAVPYQLLSLMQERQKMKLQLIEGWQQAYKFLSVQIAAPVAILTRGPFLTNQYLYHYEHQSRTNR